MASSRRFIATICAAAVLGAGTGFLMRPAPEHVIQTTRVVSTKTVVQSAPVPPTGPKDEDAQEERRARVEAVQEGIKAATEKALEPPEDEDSSSGKD